MGVILDSSVLIGTERGAFPLLALLEALGEQPVGMAAITASDLLHGCHRAPDAARRARRSALVERFLRDLPVHPFDLLAARRHAELWAVLARKGRLIGAHDLLIAATALARGDALATLNEREFARVPGLELVDLRAFS